MPVEDISMPPAKNVSDVKGTKEKKEGDEGYWEKQAREADAQFRYESKQKELEKIRSGGKAGEQEPAFKITGGMNLGTIDLQAQQKAAEEKLEKLRKEAEDSARMTAQENQQLREAIHKQELQLLETTLKVQIENLGKMIEGNASRKSFVEQYNEALETSKALGLGRPSVETSDLQTTLALKKLEFDQTLELRRLAKEERAEGRRWQLELRRLDDEREARKREEEREKRKDEMFAKAPEMLGGAIAKGILESKSGGGVSAPVGGKSHYQVTAPAGGAGTMACPGCGEEMAIGPTAKAAICANCETKVSIKRVAQEAMAEGEEE